jgi:hypothetical protein
LTHDVRNPEAAADLDELAAWHDRFASARECGEYQQHGRSIVVDHGSSGRPGDLRQQPLRVHAPGTALTLGQVVLEVGVAGRHVGHAPRCGRG